MTEENLLNLLYDGKHFLNFGNDTPKVRLVEFFSQNKRKFSDQSNAIDSYFEEQEENLENKLHQAEIEKREITQQLQEAKKENKTQEKKIEQLKKKLEQKMEEIQLLKLKITKLKKKRKRTGPHVATSIKLLIWIDSLLQHILALSK